MIEYVFFGLVCVACLLAMQNWRWGVYAGIVLDVLRDPVRKLAEGQSVAITLLGAVVWGVIALQVLQSESHHVRRLFRSYPRLRLVAQLIAIAIVPAAGLSCLLYPGGYKLAAIGVVSYMAPLVGVAIGFVYARSESDVYRFMKIYTLVSCVALIGVPLEFYKMDVPGLGGINFDWIRYRPGETISLISGFYRSPDIMGLHAAHVIMFSSLLALRRRQAAPGGWIAAAVWAAFCLMLSGRRKMIGIPLVFLVSYVALGVWRGTRQTQRVVGVIAVAGLIGVAVLVFADDGDDVNETAEYARYASSTFTEFESRVSDTVIGSAITTLRQAGIFGAGLGTATQGRYHLGIQTSKATRGWQEDGFSKLLLEFGLPGLVLIMSAGFYLVRALLEALKRVPAASTAQLLQIGLLAIVAGDAASFVVSHQQFSGDVVNALIVTLLVGMVLAGPRMYVAQQRVRELREMARERDEAEGVDSQEAEDHVTET